VFAIFKYLPLVGLLKDVSTAYKDETGKDRPAVLSRRFIGAVLALAGAFVSIQLGVEISADTLAQITDSLDKMVAAGTVLYGAVMVIVGLLKRKKDDIPKA